jgi:hypothetical protein
MSSSIWTRCAGTSEVRPIRLEARRAVESQHQVATRKLVDSDAEQLVLEQLIEEAKPPARAPGRLHYLLATPFRYPPLRHGSRFGSRQEPGIWYGAERLDTLLAEVAYYRLVFLEGARADLGSVQVELTVFSVRVETDRGIDLTRPPFARYDRLISSPTQYRASQALGREMRDAGVAAFRYRSARDPGGGKALALLTPAAFADRRPRRLETWRCSATRERVEFLRRDYFTSGGLAFARSQFLVEGRLPAPAP